MLYSAFLLIVFRPSLAKRLEWAGERRLQAHARILFLAVIAGPTASAAITEAIGVHFVFGSFLFGAALPSGAAPRFFGQVHDRIDPPARLFLPVFIVTPGLSLDLGALGSRELTEFGLVMFVACSGKLVGAAGAAGLFGVAPREAGAIGVLMNTRGLMELVALVIGLETGILDDRLFTVLVLMAIATTVMTAPLLRLLNPRDYDLASSRRHDLPIRR